MRLPAGSAIGARTLFFGPLTFYFFTYHREIYFPKISKLIPPNFLENEQNYKKNAKTKGIYI